MVDFDNCNVFQAGVTWQTRLSEHLAWIGAYTVGNADAYEPENNLPKATLRFNRQQNKLPKNEEEAP
jgi:hypothetical protein